MTFLAQAPITHPFVPVCGDSYSDLQILKFYYCGFTWDTLFDTTVAIAVTLIVGFLIVRNLRKGVPGKLQLGFELALSYVRGLLNEQTGGEGSNFIFPIAATLGLYILIANWLDFLPLTFFNGLHAANANLEQTAAMAIVVILIVQYYSIRVLGFGGYLRRFTKPFELPWWFRFNPIWIALNVLEEVTKPITLALRLFGNIFAGAVMVFLITLLLGQLPFFTVIWLALVVLVALVAVRAPGPLAEVGGLWRALAALLVAVLLLALLIMLRNQPPLDYGGFPVAEVTWSPLVLAVWKAFDVFFVGTIQAFIFTLLTIIYFGMAREGLEHEADAAHHAPRREPMLPAMKEEPA